MTSKVIFALCNLSNSHISESVVSIIYDMFVHKSSSTRDLLFYCFFWKWKIC